MRFYIHQLLVNMPFNLYKQVEIFFKTLYNYACTYNIFNILPHIIFNVLITYAIGYVHYIYDDNNDDESFYFPIA